MKKKKSNKSKIEKNINGLPFSSYVLMIPIMMGFALPLIVGGYAFQLSESFKNVSLSNNNYATDFFLHSKQTWLYWTVAAALFLLLCFKLLERKIFYPKKWMIFGGIYLLLAFISSLSAKDIKIAFLGGENMFQGFLVIVSYFLLFYYTYMIFMGEKQKVLKHVYLFLRCVLVLSMIFIIIGTFQLCGNDPFSWKWVQNICNVKDAQIVQDNRIYLTLYNSNYVGVMGVLLLPMLFLGVIVEKTKHMKICFAIAFIGMLGCIIASGSRTAMCVVVIVVLLVSSSIIVKNKKYRKIACVTLVITIVTTFAVIFINKDIASQINQPLPTKKTNLTGMATKQECFRLRVGKRQINVSWDNENIKFYNKKGLSYETKEVTENRKNYLLKKLPTAMTSYYGENGFKPQRLKKKAFKKIIFFRSGLQYNGKNIKGYVFYINNKPYFITNEWEEDGYYYYNLLGHFVKVYNTKDAFDESAYGFASYRGYIWSKTIPRLRKTMFIGKGMDHFSLLFPNHDYAAKAQIDKLGVIYNKPHNWYLQIAAESGIISLIMIIIMLIYILRSGCNKQTNLVLNLSGDKYILKFISIGLGVSIISYFMINMLNDQMIVTAPIFWMILGTYAGINEYIKEEQK